MGLEWMLGIFNVTWKTGISLQNTHSRKLLKKKKQLEKTSAHQRRSPASTSSTSVPLAPNFILVF